MGAEGGRQRQGRGGLASACAKALRNGAGGRGCPLEPWGGAAAAAWGLGLGVGAGCGVEGRGEQLSREPRPPGVRPSQPLLRLALTSAPPDLHTVPGVQGHWHLLGAPAPPPQLTRTPRGHSQEGTSMGRPGAAAPGLGHGGSRGHLEAPAQLRPHLQNLLTAASRNLDSAGSEEEVGRQGQPPPPWDTPQSEAAVPWEPRGRGCSCTPGPLRPPACTLLGAGRGRSRVTPGPCC